MFNSRIINKLLYLMQEKNIDVFMIGPSVNLKFLLSLGTGNCERFQAFFIKDNGDYFYISPQLYYEEISEFLEEDKIFMWKDSEVFTKAFKKASAEYNLNKKNVAVDGTIRAADLIEITGLCNCNFINGSYILEDLRVIKTDDEIKYLRRAAELADNIMGKTIEYIKPGISEHDIKRKVETEAKKLGAEGLAFEPIVASGSNSSKPHYNQHDRVIQNKDIVILDLGCQYNGYCSDISRTIFVGGITDKEREIYNIVKRANSEAERVVKEGLIAEEIDQAARNIIEKAGYGKFFINRTGHGIGMSVHELPYIKTGNRRKMLKGMAFSIEPGIYLPGEFGIRIEDIVIVTESGREILNKFTKEIIIKH